MKRPPKTTALPKAIARSCVVMPGAHDAAVARLIEKAGFPAVYISGAGLANAAAGLPDIGLLDLDEVAHLASYIVNAVKIPCLLDADTGFGDAPAVAKTIRRLEKIGVAAVHLEDQTFPKRCGHLPGKELVESAEMEEKLRAAVAARRDPDFLIIARTDARSVEGFDAAIDRAQRYLRAGADAIFPEALQTAAEFRLFAKTIRAPLLANMTEFGRGPLLSAAQLAGMGYRMVIFPLTAFRVSMKSTENLLRDLHRRGSQKSWLPKMQTRQELYDLLGYDPRKIFTPRGPTQ